MIFPFYFHFDVFIMRLLECLKRGIFMDYLYWEAIAGDDGLYGEAHF